MPKLHQLTYHVSRNHVTLRQVSAPVDTLETVQVPKD